MINLSITTISNTNTYTNNNDSNNDKGGTTCLKLLVSCGLARQLCRVADHQTLLYDSPLLKRTCVRRVVLDRW